MGREDTLSSVDLDILLRYALRGRVVTNARFSIRQIPCRTNVSITMCLCILAYGINLDQQIFEAVWKCVNSNGLTDQVLPCPKQDGGLKIRRVFRSLHLPEFAIKNRAKEQCDCSSRLMLNKCCTIVDPTLLPVHLP